MSSQAIARSAETEREHKRTGSAHLLRKCYRGAAASLSTVTFPDAAIRQVMIGSQNGYARCTAVGSLISLKPRLFGAK
jgi:hypothetical protein